MNFTKSIPLVGIIVLLTCFLVFKSFFLYPNFSDETVYFNVAKNLKENLPYKDFFFAHPPLQIVLLSSILSFADSFFFVKMFMLIISGLVSLVIYFLAKDLNDKKVAFLSTLLFIISPFFIVFSGQGYGMWETLLFLLLSSLFALRGMIKTSALFLALGIFTRYLLILYLPLVLILMFYKKLDYRKFLVFLIIFTALFFIPTLIVFGYDFINQTIGFQLFSQVVYNLPKHLDQFQSFGFFTFFLSLIAAFVGYWNKDKLLMTLAIYPALIDILLIASFKTLTYHYFSLSLPFIMIAASRAFFSSKESIAKVGIIVISLLAVYSNISTINFYFSPENSEAFDKIADYIGENSLETQKIFGEPVMTNYVSFVADRKISGNYFDSYIRHLEYEGIDNVINKLERDKPHIIIDDGYLYSIGKFQDFINENYVLSKKFITSHAEYRIYIRKS